VVKLIIINIWVRIMTSLARLANIVTTDDEKPRSSFGSSAGSGHNDAASPRFDEEGMIMGDGDNADLNSVMEGTHASFLFQTKTDANSKKLTELKTKYDIDENVVIPDSVIQMVGEMVRNKSKIVPPELHKALNALGNTVLARLTKAVMEAGTTKTMKDAMVALAGRVQLAGEIDWKDLDGKISELAAARLNQRMTEQNPRYENMHTAVVEALAVGVPNKTIEAKDKPYFLRWFVMAVESRVRQFKDIKGIVQWLVSNAQYFSDVEWTLQSAKTMTSKPKSIEANRKADAAISTADLTQLHLDKDALASLPTLKRDIFSGNSVGHVEKNAETRNMMSDAKNVEKKQRMPDEAENKTIATATTYTDFVADRIADVADSLEPVQRLERMRARVQAKNDDLNIVRLCMEPVFPILQTYAQSLEVTILTRNIIEVWTEYLIPLHVADLDPEGDLKLESVSYVVQDDRTLEGGEKNDKKTQKARKTTRLTVDSSYFFALVYPVVQGEMDWNEWVKYLPAMEKILKARGHKVHCDTLLNMGDHFAEGMWPKELAWLATLVQLELRGYPGFLADIDRVNITKELKDARSCPKISGDMLHFVTATPAEHDGKKAGSQNTNNESIDDQTKNGRPSTDRSAAATPRAERFGPTPSPFNGLRVTPLTPDVCVDSGKNSDAGFIVKPRSGKITAVAKVAAPKIGKNGTKPNPKSGMKSVRKPAKSDANLKAKAKTNAKSGVDGKAAEKKGKSNASATVTVAESADSDVNMGLNLQDEDEIMMDTTQYVVEDYQDDDGAGVDVDEESIPLGHDAFDFKAGGGVTVNRNATVSEIMLKLAKIFGGEDDCFQNYTRIRRISNAPLENLIAVYEGLAAECKKNQTTSTKPSKKTGIHSAKSSPPSKKSKNSVDEKAKMVRNPILLHLLRAVVYAARALVSIAATQDHIERVVVARTTKTSKESDDKSQSKENRRGAALAASAANMMTGGFGGTLSFFRDHVSSVCTMQQQTASVYCVPQELKSSRDAVDKAGTELDKALEQNKKKGDRDVYNPMPDNDVMDAYRSVSGYLDVVCTKVFVTIYPDIEIEAAKLGEKMVADPPGAQLLSDFYAAYGGEEMMKTMHTSMHKQLATMQKSLEAVCRAEREMLDEPSDSEGTF